MTDMESLAESIASPLQSGFGTPDPNHPDWESTRPGARPGERLAYTRNVDGEESAYISIVEHEEGEVDEDEYEWGSDCYEIIISRGDGTQEFHTLTDPEDVGKAVAQEMMDY